VRLRKDDKAAPFPQSAHYRRFVQAEQSATARLNIKLLALVPIQTIQCHFSVLRGQANCPRSLE
jgi:hypothetical protein